MDKDKVFEIKESIKVEGITDDYVWWNKEKLLLDMRSWEFNFKRMCEVMEARHNEHLKMIEDLLSEIKQLKKEKAAPPKREWVGLTPEEAKEISLANRPYVIDMVYALEAKLKEKNT